MINNRKGYKSKQVDMEQLVLLLKLEVPKTRIAKTLGIGRATLYRIIQESVDG